MLSVYISPMKLTEYGKREWLGWGIVAIIFIVVFIVCAGYNQVLFLSLASMTGVLYIALALFFRDPKRNIPKADNVLVAPADGIIHDIELLKDVEENQFFEGNDTVRIGIFLSLFNVHINRAPCDMEVKEKQYREGKYHDARSAKAQKENESMTISCVSTVKERRFSMLLRQISGAVAKRIVCNVEPGRRLAKGERFGMIKFGSRTELYLPAATWMELTVKSGDKVKAGETIIAKIVE